jgi:hypothetical protein
MIVELKFATNVWITVIVVIVDYVMIVLIIMGIVLMIVVNGKMKEKKKNDYGI